MSDFLQWTELWPLGIDGSMSLGPQARLYDPMWLLSRQIQFGEFRHDGGSTPVDIAVDLAVGQPTRMRAGTAASTDTVEIRLGSSPFEAVVEQEPISQDGLDGLRLRAEAGLYLQRLLRAAGLAAQASAWASRCAFQLPAKAVVDDETRDWFDMMTGRVPDGRLLGGIVGRVVTGQDTTVPLAPGELDVLKAWRAGIGVWLHSARGTGNWDPEQLEYRLSASAVVGSGEVVLDVPQYVEGTLDWYAFDVGSGTLGLSGTTATRRLHRAPVSLAFAGMPNNRFWTFEDPTVNFDTLALFSRTDRKPSTAAMMALEFALSYGDDWYQLPIPLALHTICNVTAVQITDCFGDVVTAQRPPGRWNLYRLDVQNAPDQLGTVFMHASPNQVLDGETIEEIHLLRDEQANLAWAVEAVVPRPLGGGSPPATVPPPPAAVTGTGPTWTLAPTTLPRNWFPLVPTTADPGRLSVGTLWSARDARPQGRVLAELPAGKQLHDDGIPSEGVQLTRTWQSARAADGSLHFWIGRMKTPRQTDIAPALLFDIVAR